MTLLGAVADTLRATADSLAASLDSVTRAESASSDASRAASAFGVRADVQQLEALRHEIGDQETVLTEVREILNGLSNQAVALQTGADAAHIGRIDPSRVMRLHERPRWEVRPLLGVGPLRFGMTYQQVVVALGNPTAYMQSYTSHTDDARMMEARFDDVGITTFYGEREAGRDLLYGVASEARYGPQFLLDGFPLVGRRPSQVGRWFEDNSQSLGSDLRYTSEGCPVSQELGLIIRTECAGDFVLTRAVAMNSNWADLLEHDFDEYAMGHQTELPG